MDALIITCFVYVFLCFLVICVQCIQFRNRCKTEGSVEIDLDDCITFIVMTLLSPVTLLVFIGQAYDKHKYSTLFKFKCKEKKSKD
jgi:hypothetical protein